MNNPRNDKWRHIILRWLVALLFVGFAGFAGYLQLVEGNDYYSKAEDNVIRYIITYPPRGEVFDRNGEYLIQNRICYDLMIIPREAPKDGIDTARLIAITGEPIKRLRRSFSTALIGVSPPPEARFFFLSACFSRIAVCALFSNAGSMINIIPHKTNITPINTYPN